MQYGVLVKLCWYSGISIYLEVLGIVNDFVTLSNSKMIYMEKNLDIIKFHHREQIGPLALCYIEVSLYFIILGPVV